MAKFKRIDFGIQAAIYLDQSDPAKMQRMSMGNAQTVPVSNDFKTQSSRDGCLEWATALRLGDIGITLMLLVGVEMMAVAAYRYKYRIDDVDERW